MQDAALNSGICQVSFRSGSPRKGGKESPATVNELTKTLTILVGGIGRNEESSPRNQFEFEAFRDRLRGMSRVRWLVASPEEVCRMRVYRMLRQLTGTTCRETCGAIWTSDCRQLRATSRLALRLREAKGLQRDSVTTSAISPERSTRTWTGRKSSPGMGITLARHCLGSDQYSGSKPPRPFLRSFASQKNA